MLWLQLPATVVFCHLPNTHHGGRANPTLRRFGRAKQKPDSRSVSRL